jgi:hypothetical protein
LRSCILASLRGAKATKQSISLCRAMDCFAEPVIGRAFARPVGSQRRYHLGCLKFSQVVITRESGCGGDLLGGRFGLATTQAGETRSTHLTIFWHCGLPHFSSRTGSEATPGNEPSIVLAEDGLPKGLAMLIRSQMYGVQGGAATAAGACAIPAASLPTLSLCGLLLLICP